ncbi:DNA pilot protein [robinz microvirus RP_133]|nr:DNA pilot protein [robinz microvirus RP_133]
MVWQAALIGAAAEAAGGLMSRFDARKARIHDENAIQFRVADAKKAGIHPLYALGAGGVASNAYRVADSNWIGDMGQNVSRAMLATAGREERAEVDALRLKNMELQNEFLQAQINSERAKSVAQLPPPLPGYGVYEPSAPKVDFSRPGESSVTAGPAGPAYTEYDAGLFGKLNFLSPNVASSLDDMELLKYALMYGANKDKIDSAVSDYFAPHFDYVWQRQKAVEEATDRLRRWANSQQNTRNRKKSYWENRAHPNRYWGREVR